MTPRRKLLPKTFVALRLPRLELVLNLGLSVGLSLSMTTAHAADDTEPLPVTITSPLIETYWQYAPSGVSLINDEDIGSGRAPLQATDSLNLAPGVLVQNRDNFAQNPRVSIRGFGARAPFGIRGVRVRLDGIPLTTVDGQAQIDAIDPSTIHNIEVLRGANAVLHGNGSGGLLDYQSYSPGHTPYARLEAQLGGFGLRRLHAAYSQNVDDQNINSNHDNSSVYRGAISQLEQDGYREQSAVVRRNSSLRYSHQQGSRKWFAILNRLDNPMAEDPGGLTYEQWQNDPTQASALASAMNAGQQVTQTIASIGMEQRFNGKNHQLRAQTWLTERDFKQQLPFPGDSLIHYDRQIIGGSVNYQNPLSNLILHTQLSIEHQNDDRQRFCRDTSLQPFICRIGITDDLALDQKETARNVGLGFQLAGPLAQQQQGRWVLGLRHDRLQLAIDDKLQPGGIDNSGERLYNETHYSLAYSHNLDNSWSLFSQFATSFEAPTFTEFANPTGSGFRPGLKPQFSRNLEIGLRTQQNHYQFETSLFTVRVTDEIIVDDNPGAAVDDERTFYRNADRTHRNGLEIGGRWWPNTLPPLELAGALTYMQARFDDTSNNLPGLPDWSAFIDAKYKMPKGYFTGAAIQHIGTRYADDDNTVNVASQAVTNLRFGRKLSNKQYDTQLVIGIENLFDVKHLSNLRINARNARYYEPGADRRLYASLEINWF